MAAKRYDAIVLGADIEGLAASCTLAAAGKKVALVDGRGTPGGLASRVAVGDGFHAPGLALEGSLARLDLLAGCGVAVDTAGAPGLHTLDPRGATLAPRLSEGSRSWTSDLVPLLTDWLAAPPPEIARPGPGDLVGLARFGLRLRRLGRRDLPELLRVATLPAWDWLADLTSEGAKAALVAPTLRAGVVGPRAAGTSGLLLLQALLRGREPAGGLAALRDALVARAEASGVSLEPARGPSSILVEAGRVAGVQLEDGETLSAPVVLSAFDPAHTLLDLVDPRFIERAVERELQGWRRGGSCAVVLLALRELPELASGGAVPDRFVTATDLTQLERAADALKYGSLPEAPWYDARVWSGAPFAPAGGATLVVHIHGVGRGLRMDAADARASVRARLLTDLEVLLPGLEAALVHDEVLLPVDLEERFGLAGGHLFGGELALDQLWITRPSLELSRYRTPIEGLWLGGPGSHPGGPFHGGAGILAGRAVLGER
ncbi:MAG TPA: NAD(P)/FAD-dependent oxidoreductase [Planctomycetes bacterium]|nr:NAD(P)/FAD-dependent oxidoreductase [Planctomycetota bacterium]